MRAKLYKQTGFNAVDIPDSIETLENNFQPFKTENNLNLVQNEYLAYLTIGDINNYEARLIDYIIIEEEQAPTLIKKTCYTVESFEMVQPEVCKLFLLIDAYNTMGGFGPTSGNLIVAGSANRMSVSITEDNTQFFTLDEPFRPAGKIKIVTDDLQKPSDYQETYPLIETLTIPPQTVQAQIKQGAGNITQYNANVKHRTMGLSNGEYVMKQETTTPAGTIECYTTGQNISPKARKLKTTTLNDTAINGTVYQVTQGTRWWLEWKTAYNITVDGEAISGNLIQDFRDNGKDQDIISFWRIPIQFVSLITDSDYSPTEETNYGGIDTIENKIYAKTLTITPKTTYNNKAKYSQNIAIKIISPVSASQLDKKLYEIIDTNNTPLQASYTAGFYVGADITPTGSPFFMFKYVNGTEQVKNKTYEIINGGAWRTIPLTATGVSNKNYENARINQQANVAKYGDIMSMTIGAIGLITGAIATGGTSAVAQGIAGAGISLGARSLVGGIKGYAEHSYNQAEQQRILAMQGEQASVQLTVGNSTYLREVGDNYFVGIIATYNDADTEAYDTFLTKYGYNVGNKPITNADFYSRPAFNYMRVNDIVIESVNVGINVLNLVRQQLQAGVRIWHKKPTPQDMFAGGNRQ